MLVLYGASALGDCGDWQFFRILESPDTPVARPRMELHLSRIAGPALEVEAGSDLNERDLGALQKVIEAEGLMRPTVRKGERSTRLALASSGAAGGTGFAAVDLDSVRRTARAVYRLVRELASE
jgi:hypothetical protein